MNFEKNRKTISNVLINFVSRTCKPPWCSTASSGFIDSKASRMQGAPSGQLITAVISDNNLSSICKKYIFGYTSSLKYNNMHRFQNDNYALIVYTEIYISALYYFHVTHENYSSLVCSTKLLLTSIMRIYENELKSLLEIKYF